MRQLKTLENQEQNKSRPSQPQERRKIKAEISEIETKEIIQRIGELKNWFLEKINKVGSANQREKRGP